MKRDNAPALKSLLGEETSNYINEHEGLLKQVLQQVEVEEDSIKRRIATDNPFAQEEALVAELKKTQPADVSKNILAIEKKYKTAAKGSNILFDFYKSEFKKAEELTGAAKREKVKAVHQTLLKELKTQLLLRKSAWHLQLIDRLREKYIKKLLEKLKKFQKLEKLLSPFLDQTGILWDMSQGLFHESGFELLETYADLLEREESLRELARILGRHNRAQKEFEKELRSKTVIKSEWYYHPAYKGQVSGVCTSNNISSALPSELALFKNPATKRLFEKKFAEKALLSFKYENAAAVQKEESITEEVSKEKEEQKGPIIICVDTSGSMNGTPENIAKTITFALSKMALEEKRNCYLISFSTQIETLDLSALKGGDALQNLIRFLRMSFHGGTDALPALEHALVMLQREDYKKADVLMISDFVMPGIEDSIKQAILVEQEKKTNFHSLVIGSTGDSNALSCFNHNWSYNYHDPQDSRKLIEQLQDIKDR